MFCYCATARRIARALTARYDAALAPALLTAAQFELLNTLQALQPCAGRVLAEALAVDKTTLSRNLQTLVSTRLVLAKPATDDVRKVQYRLAAEGVRRLAKAMPLWQAIHANTEDGLGANAQPALQRVAAAL